MLQTYQPCGHSPRARTAQHLRRQHSRQCSRQRQNVAQRHRLRTDYSDGDPDIEKPFYILKHTYCAAVLTENDFMDSEVSLSFLEFAEGQKAVVALHVDGIIDYIEGR